MTILHPHHTDPVLELYDQALAIDQAEHQMPDERIHLISKQTAKRVHRPRPNREIGKMTFRLSEDEQIDLFKLHGRRELLD